MIATQIRQKDGVFYFVSYPAQDLLTKVRFISRFYADDGSIEAEEVSSDDEVASFIRRIEKSDAAFQRQISRAKVAAIENFYETAVSQPPIPGTVLLFTSEKLRFEPLGKDRKSTRLNSSHSQISYAVFCLKKKKKKKKIRNRYTSTVQP